VQMCLDFYERHQHITAREIMWRMQSLKKCNTRSLVLCECFVDRCLSCPFSFWSCSLFSFDLRILITPLVSSNSSYLFFVFLNTMFSSLYLIQELLI
jgi:hypothetical protein